MGAAAPDGLDAIDGRETTGKATARCTEAGTGAGGTIGIERDTSLFDTSLFDTSLIDPPPLDRERFDVGEAVVEPVVVTPESTCGRSWFGPSSPRTDGDGTAAPPAPLGVERGSTGAVRAGSDAPVVDDVASAGPTCRGAPDAVVAPRVLASPAAVDVADELDDGETTGKDIARCTGARTGSGGTLGNASANELDTSPLDTSLLDTELFDDGERVDVPIMLTPDSRCGAALFGPSIPRTGREGDATILGAEGTASLPDDDDDSEAAVLPGPGAPVAAVSPTGAVATDEGEVPVAALTPAVVAAGVDARGTTGSDTSRCIGAGASAMLGNSPGTEAGASLLDPEPLDVDVGDPEGFASSPAALADSTRVPVTPESRYGKAVLGPPIPRPDVEGSATLSDAERGSGDGLDAGVTTGGATARCTGRGDGDGSDDGALGKSPGSRCDRALFGPPVPRTARGRAAGGAAGATVGVTVGVEAGSIHGMSTVVAFASSVSPSPTPAGASRSGVACSLGDAGATARCTGIAGAGRWAPTGRLLAVSGTAEIGAPRPRVLVAVVGWATGVAGATWVAGATGVAGAVVSGATASVVGALAGGGTTGRGIGEIDEESRRVSGSTTDSSTTTCGTA
ncbi:hypothetical protein [Kribbia dieselivorans]|uniref:hypothetical protein n=1 Tax=Kribbia dieselivorans TaxID=331526 RepID=UPI0012ED87F0|nr:hypothetical protein [Kribbia dieselivorans]